MSLLLAPKIPGVTTRNSARRLDQRSVGLAAAREPDRLDRPGSVSRGTACGSQRSNHHVLHSRSLFSRNKRTISFHSTRLHVRICEQEASAKNLAGRVGNNPQADRNHSLEEPFTHSSSAAFHRLCSQRC